LTEVFEDWFTLDLDKYLATAHPGSGARVIYERIEETGEPEPGPDVHNIGLPDQLVKTLEKRGIRRLYKFQYEAFKCIVNGDNVVIVAGTGAGKTEAFFIPLAKKILEEEQANPRVLLLYPTKALARDQVKRFVEYSVYGRFGVGIYDGDTPGSARRKIASNPPPIVVSNPDMLHVGLIYSSHIRKFVEVSSAMVFDELHVYEGVLGSHLHHLVHRLKLTRNKKAQFIASSATIGNPKEFAESLFEEEFREVRGSLARKGTVVHILVSSGYLSRWSAVASIAKFLADRGFRFILFVDSQQVAELLASTIESRYGVNVAVHRAGLSHEVRRDVEGKLREGLLQGVVSTPTLELGIDIGVLDVVVLAAPPPSYTKYLQRAGRAGRRKKGYVITVLGDDPIDAYYARKPKEFFEQGLLPSVVEPLNEEIIKLHFLAYLLQVGRIHVSKVPCEWSIVLDDLVSNRLLKIVGPYVVALYGRIHEYVKKRGGIRGQGELVEIIDVKRNEVIATRESPTAVLELYPGAVYLCMKRNYEVLELDIENKRAYVREVGVGPEVYTRPLYTVDIVDYDVLEERGSSIGAIAYSKVLLEVVVDGYVVKNTYTGETRCIKALERPVTYTYITKAVLVKLPLLEELELHGLAEAYHAIEHAIIASARITCGAGLTDLGGISYPSGDIAIYDAAIGGSGLSKSLYMRFEDAVRTAYELMKGCTCEDGCPKCIYTPYCGNNNKVLSKKKALYVLSEALKQGLILREKPLARKMGKPLA